MSKGNRPRAQGQLNRGQVITTYGPGAMVDLPEEAVLISGLNHWKMGKQISEPRLVNHIRKHMNMTQLVLREPPLDDDNEEMTAPGIDAMVFPGWFLANVEKTITRDNRTYRTRPMFRISQVKAGKVIYEGKKVSVTPVRFVRACDNGHLSDIDWRYFLFGKEAEHHKTVQLWMDEGGSGNDLTEVYVRSNNHPPVSLGQAAMPDAPFLALVGAVYPG